MSDANQTAFYAVKETTWGETPDGSATLVEIPTTGDTLAMSKLTADRATIKSNRMGAKSRHVGTDVAGESNHELTHGDFADIIGGLLSDTTPDTTAISAETCTTSASGNTITADAGTPFTALAALDPKWLKIGGGAQSGTNGVKKITSITSTVITVAAGELTTDETSVNLDIDSILYTNASDDVSFLIERQYSDTSHKFWFNGCIPAAGTISMDPRSIITLGVTWVGKDHAVGLAGTSGYAVNDAAHAAGVGTLTVDTGTRNLLRGQKFTVAGDATVYTLTEDSGASATTLTFTPVGVEALANDAVITLAPDPLLSAGDGSPTADSGDDAMNSSSDVVGLYIDDLLVTDCISNISISVDNGQRVKPCIQELTTAKPGKNRFRVTGSVTFHFSASSFPEYADFLSHASKSLAVGFQDPAGNFIGLELPAITWDTSPGPIPSGEDTDVVLTMDFSAYEPASGVARMIGASFMSA
jgi:hypothetical protein